MCKTHACLTTHPNWNAISQITTTSFPHGCILSLALSSRKTAWKNIKSRAFWTRNGRVMGGNISSDGLGMGWNMMNGFPPNTWRKWSFGCVAGERWWWAGWMVAFPGFLKFFPRVLMAPNSCWECWCCSPCYLLLTDTLFFQMLEGCKPVLTTIGISATFPDSRHILVYVYVHLTPWLHRPSRNPFFSRVLSSVCPLTTSYPLLFLNQYTLVSFPSWSDPVFPVQDAAGLHLCY